MTNIELKYTSNGMLMHGYINGKLLYPEQVSQVIFDAIKDWSQLPYDLKSPKTIEMYLTNFSDSYLRTLQNILGNREINFTATGDSYQYNLRETKMTNEQLRMQMLSGIITEGKYKAKLQENSEKSSLNESMIGGIVGVGAIAQIPPREKADYEMAFEHFLGERYETKFENREQDLEEGNPLVAGPGFMSKQEIVKLTQLIASAELQLAKQGDMINPESLAKAEQTISDLRAARERAIEKYKAEIKDNYSGMFEGDENLMENNGMNVVANILGMIKNGNGDEEIIAYMMDNNFESEEQAREQLLLLKGALDKMKQAINPAPSRFQSQLAAMRDKYSR
jgi:hypothetical protein